MVEEKKDVSLFKGLGVSPGIVIGRAYIYDRNTLDNVKQVRLERKEVSSEVARFKDALKLSKKQLRDIKRKLAKEKVAREHLSIVDAHMMILNDQMIVSDTLKLIKSERINAEWALRSVLKEIVKLFDAVDDKYFKARSSDIEHIVDRIIMNLSGKNGISLADISVPSIVIAHDLSPTDTAQMAGGKVLGFLTDVGGRTSHTAILARSLEIPAVVGLEKITKTVEAGDVIVVDGTTGTVIVNPSESVLKVYEKRRERYRKYFEALRLYRNLPATTLDGKNVAILGNMEMSEEVTSLVNHGIDGIGLYRTEFLYLNRNDLPTEEEHVAAYKHVVKKMKGRPVVIRTLDVGGDKILSHASIENETNPAMGLRAIRFCLKRHDIFKTQLRGILKASVFGEVKIMFPMISGMEELRRAKDILGEAKAELRSEGVAFDEDISVGIMIEVPSAALIADLLAKEADFFSIGTNDLVQYSIAIDRVNEHVAYLYEPLHPAILRLIKSVADAANKAGIVVSVCGEMAGEPGYALLFMGMGITSLSMSALSVLKVKKLIRAVKYSDAVYMTKRSLEFHTAKEVEGFLVSSLAGLYVDEFNL